LVPVSDDEYARFAEEQVREYAGEKTRAGDWTEAEALRRSREEHAALLADRLRRFGHRIFKVVDAGGTRVGWIWEGPSPLPDPPEGQRWLYQITIAPAHRGRGHGRESLAGIESLLRSEGTTSLQLHVFRWNSTALALYRSAGYAVVYDGANDLNLVKRLDGR
jgi:ribosomal protein S18 acetylase RimI-like enzyme